MLTEMFYGKRPSHLDKGIEIVTLIFISP